MMYRNIKFIKKKGYSVKYLVPKEEIFKPLGARHIMLLVRGLHLHATLFTSKSLSLSHVILLDPNLIGTKGLVVVVVVVVSHVILLDMLSNRQIY